MSEPERFGEVFDANSQSDKTPFDVLHCRTRNTSTGGKPRRIRLYSFGAAKYAGGARFEFPARLPLKHEIPIAIHALRSASRECRNRVRRTAN